MKDRESIAFTSARDLQNTSNIYALNKETRAVPMATEQTQLTHDENVAGCLRQEDKNDVED